MSYLSLLLYPQISKKKKNKQTNRKQKQKNKKIGSAMSLV